MKSYPDQLKRLARAFDVPVAEAETLLQEVKVIDHIRELEE